MRIKVKSIGGCKKEEILMASCELCIERAKYITAYLEQNKNNMEHNKLKFAKAIRYYLSHKNPVILSHNLIAGMMTSKKEGINLYPEIGDLVIWRSLRMKGLMDEEISLLNEQIFPYWMERDLQTYFEEQCKEVKYLKDFKNQGFCRIEEYRGFVPDFKMILEEGLEALLEEVSKRLGEVKNKIPILKEHLLKEAQEQAIFYESVREVGYGLLNYVAHLEEAAKVLSEEVEDELQKQIYLKMARTCKKIPAQAAGSFYEAIQCIWFYVIAMGAEYHLEGMSLGRLDQILYPYYKKDLLKGRLTEEEALTLIKELCTKLYYCKNIKGESTLGITIGGINELGEDSVNAVTYLFLKAISSLEDEMPNITARIHREKNISEYIECVSKVGQTMKLTLQEDQENIKRMTRKGISLENSRNYAVMADGVLGFAGLSYEGSQKLSIDMTKIFNLALNNGRQQETGKRQWGPLTGEVENLEHFDEFLRAFKTQGEWLIKQSIMCLELGEEVAKENIQWPFAALLFKGCIQRGEDLVRGGSVYADVEIRKSSICETARLLAYTKQVVFKEEGIKFKNAVKNLKTMEEYKDSDFNNIDTEIILQYKRWLIEFLQSVLRGYSNPRGGGYF